MTFRILDVVRYGIKVSKTDAFNVLPQVLLKKKIIKFKPDRFGSISVRNFTSDVVAFKQVFLWEEYRFPIKGRVNVIIDAGANIGCASRWFRKEFVDAEIYAIEPEHKNFQLLTENTKKLEKFESLETGIWSKVCKLSLTNFREDNWTFQVREAEPSALETMDAVSINTLLSKYYLRKIDILKLDIETAEREIFAENYDTWIPLCRYIFVETHDFIEKGCSKAVFKTMDKYDFSLAVLGENLIFINNRFKD